VVKPGLGRQLRQRSDKGKILRNVRGVAVVKVTPPIGSVKYKAQHVVLPVRIPVLTGGKWPRPSKNKGFCCGFSPKAAKLTGYWSVKRPRLRVGATRAKNKAQKWCKPVWTSVEMWEIGTTTGRKQVPFLHHLDRRRFRPKVKPRRLLVAKTVSPARSAVPELVWPCRRTRSRHSHHTGSKLPRRHQGNSYRCPASCPSPRRRLPVR